MPLFHVQDNDRPAYVAAENDGESHYLPRGAALIAEDSGLILESGFEA